MSRTTSICSVFIVIPRTISRSILHSTEEKQNPGLLILIDFEKGFDSVSWDFLCDVLKFFNFGDSFVKWITVFNKNIKVYVIQSSFLSDPINIECGCRQGDPIAPCLFIICAQILCFMVMHNRNIKGISFNNTEIKMSQYADNTTLILCGDEQSLMVRSTKYVGNIWSS